jgi:superfamily II DNA or RNA helicase
MWSQAWSWLPVQRRRATEESGELCTFISLLDPYHPILLAEMEDGTRIKLTVPFLERFPCFSDAVTYGDPCIRIGALVKDQDIIRYVAVTSRNIEDFFCKGDMRMVSIILRLCRDTVQNCILHLECSTDAMPYGVSRSWGRVPLLESQEESVQWMLALEKCRLYGVKHEAPARIPFPHCSWCYDVNTDSLVPLHESKSQMCLNLRGGILADGSGTGKTAVTLRAICNDTPPPIDDSKGKTLVVVPPNLVSQWREEVSKFTRNLRVLCLDDEKQVTFDDALKSDIVICSWQHLRSATYLTTAFDTLQKVPFLVSDVKCSLRDRAILRLLSDRVRCDTRLRMLSLVVEMITWRRVVLDECHEYFVSSTSSRDRLALAHALLADTLWGLSATPPSFNSIEECKMATGLFSATPRQSCSAMQACFFERVGIRGNAFVWNNVSHVLHLPKLNTFERMLLQSSDEETVSDILRGSFAESGDPPTVAVQYNRLIEEYDARIKSLHERLYYCEYTRTREEAAVAIDTERLGLSREDRKAQFAMKREIRRHKRSIVLSTASYAKYSTELQRAKQKLSYIVTRSRHFNSPHVETCPICMEEVAATVTDCGHLLCFKCVENLRGLDEFCCPICRTVVRHTNDVSVACSYTLATKVQCVVDILMRLAYDGERCVTFLRHKKHVKTIKTVTQQMNLQSSVLTLEGSVSRRAESLNSFRRVPASVLLISTDESFTGLDLTCCHHVILCAPSGDDAQTSRAIEAQAVGRVLRVGQTIDVKIHHVVCKDTWEEDAWMAQHTGLQYEVAH